MKTTRTILPTLEPWTTRRFFWTVCLAAGIPVVSFAVVVALTSVSLDNASQLVDSVVKISVTVIAASWALNRYFLSRVDAEQIRIDPRVDLVAKPGQASAALLYGIELVNTGKVLLDDYEIRVEITALDFTDSESSPSYFIVSELPWHQGRPVEPASWAAISGAEIVPRNLIAARLFVEIRRSSGIGWTWHRVIPLKST